MEESPKMVSSCKINGYDNENGLTNGNSASAASSKISKITRRIRESCQQHLRKKHSSGGASCHPEDYGSISLPNVSIIVVKVRVGNGLLSPFSSLSYVRLNLLIFCF